MNVRRINGITSYNLDGKRLLVLRECINAIIVENRGS